MMVHSQSDRRDMNRFVRRSSLIFPVNVQRFVEKAYLRGADCVVMDLEDSVPNSEKEAARALIRDYIPVVGKGGADVCVRINRPMEQAMRDLEASVWPGLACVSLPKVESAEEVRVRDGAIAELEGKRGLPLGSIQMAIAVETSLGVIRAYDIASASARIVTMSLGSEDLTGELGVQTSAEGDELWYARSKILMDSYAAGVQPMGLVGVDPFTWGDPEKICEAAVKSRNLGFKGALSIHPGPIASLNRGFSIPPEEVDHMKAALEAFEDGVRSGTASVNVNGRMIDIATAERCRRVIERAAAIEEKEKRKIEALRDPEALEERLRSSIQRSSE